MPWYVVPLRNPITELQKTYAFPSRIIGERKADVFISIDKFAGVALKFEKPKGQRLTTFQNKLVVQETTGVLVTNSGRYSCVVVYAFSIVDCSASCMFRPNDENINKYVKYKPPMKMMQPMAKNIA
jgi:hypothetical protein